MNLSHERATLRVVSLVLQWLLFLREPSDDPFPLFSLPGTIGRLFFGRNRRRRFIRSFIGCSLPPRASSNHDNLHLPHLRVSK